MGRLDAKLVRLIFHFGPVTEEVTLTEAYTFPMITDGFVACGLIKTEDRDKTEYIVVGTNARYSADHPITLGESSVKPWDHLTVVRKGGEGHERRHARIRRLS
ncbi:MAG: hypothetical protein IKU83_06240 [Lachnospiraceae bacterium]|nr:hypothetical protein [Lachnospiraceae bacterium]